MLSQTQKEVALRQGTQYINFKYLQRWKGQRLNVIQTLQWPRFGVMLDSVRSSSNSSFDSGIFHGLIPSNIVPVPVQQATCEAAVRASSAQLAPDLPRGGRIQSRKIDVIETTYFNDAPSSTTFPLIEMILGDYISSASSCDLVRC